MKEKRSAEKQIRNAMLAFMDAGDVYAAQVFKGWALDATYAYGWHYIKFGRTATYMGDNLAEALQWCKDNAELRAMDR